jgi:hypothetical protein
MGAGGGRGKAGVCLPLGFMENKNIKKIYKVLLIQIESVKTFFFYHEYSREISNNNIR